MHGAPGAGKTCSKHLLLNEPPPSSTNSTPIACPAVQATRISIDDKNNKWERVNIKDLYQQLASHLEENLEDKTENDKIPSEVDEALKSEDDDMPVVEDDDKFDGSDESSIEDSTTNQLPRNKQDENEQCAEETIKNESAEKKSIEIDPIETEVIQNVRNVQQTKKFCTNWVYFIDSGGQPAYRELLPLFTRAAALNIITIDLTKGLDEKCKFQYRIDQHPSLIDTDLKYSNRDIIRSTICSEAMSTSIEIPDVFKPDKPKDKISNESKPDKPSHSHYLILGTRVDDESVTEKKLKETNKSLREYIANDKVIKQNERKGSIIFPVNTLLPAGSKEREEASVELCTAVSNCKVEMTIKLPIRLFAFEIALQLEANKKKRSFLTRDEVIEIGKSLRLDKESESDIDDALQYLHIVTIILYYRDILPNIIFVDPKPILDVLSRLIAITYVDHNELHLIARVPNERNNLMKFGIFRKTLLEKIGAQNIFNDDFQPSHMIDLLKNLHIIAKVENRGEGDYFFPCALPSLPYDKQHSLNDRPTEIRPLLIAWEINNSGTTTLAIPQGLFPLTIVHLLERKGIVDFAPDPDSDSDSGSDSEDEVEFYRYNDAISLSVDIKSDEYTIDIINRYTHIELRLDESSKEFCPQIRELVTDAIKKSSNDLKVGQNHVLAFKCPRRNKQSYCIVKEDLSSTRCTQCRLDCKVLQGDDDSYRCWFSDCQSSSPATDASPVQPHQDSTTVNINPDSDGAGQLGITDLNMVVRSCF
ncbi:PREDICTED: uncharacterized protein LOC109588003 [Amphimedon queenslandica]|uniref:COR domain-containing protein n=1 Tax=Amphimedon queenslandica TaxID=400682 RepID=A0AAN0JSG8_AMPQE|nr:PREDICTED: uncharacterized protein LOC109588003 [Amphimedon queenslandica]|eukprot:XP_019859763.1 PREDICTED: uncharacterized protein LOC109588003 [Amphimedon queenslandica]